MTERPIQREAVQALRQMGYTVCVTSNKRHTSNTKGTPDVFVCIEEISSAKDSEAGIPTGYWIALEFKSSKGKLSPEQEQIESGVYVCRSVQDAIDAVMSEEGTEEP